VFGGWLGRNSRGFEPLSLGHSNQFGENCFNVCSPKGRADRRGRSPFMHCVIDCPSTGGETQNRHGDLDMSDTYEQTIKKIGTRRESMHGVVLEEMFAGNRGDLRRRLAVCTRHGFCSATEDKSQFSKPIEGL
jgi:hypothetical protein